MSVKVVITGGAGFIGSHICEYWLSENAEVHIIDNLHTGFQKNIDLFPKAVFHRGSIENVELLNKVFEGADYIHHLAALISVPESMQKPLDYIKININGLINVLEAAKSHKVRKVVHSSSAAIYGDNPESPKRVNMLPDPKSPYGVTKLDGEYYLKIYNEFSNLGTASLRYFNVFGPRQDPNSQYAAAIPIFVNKALKNETLTIYGDGEQTRDFVFVKDVVQANVLAATTPQATGIYNVANGSSITIKELTELIVETTGSSSRIVHADPRPGDVKHSLASIAETKKELGYTPKYDLVSGLKETIHYFMDLFKN